MPCQTECHVLRKDVYPIAKRLWRTYWQEAVPNVETISRAVRQRDPQANLGRTDGLSPSDASLQKCTPNTRTPKLGSHPHLIEVHDAEMG